MCTIDVGIGHDYDLVVCQLGEVCFFWVVFGAYGHAHGTEQVCDFLIVEYLVVHGFFYVEDLSSQWQYCLELAVASLLCAAACGVTFDNEQFAVLGCA